MHKEAHAQIRWSTAASSLSLCVCASLSLCVSPLWCANLLICRHVYRYTYLECSARDYSQPAAKVNHPPFHSPVDTFPFFHSPLPFWSSSQCCQSQLVPLSLLSTAASSTTHTRAHTHHGPQCGSFTTTTISSTIPKQHPLSTIHYPPSTIDHYHYHTDLCLCQRHRSNRKNACSLFWCVVFSLLAHGYSSIEEVHCSRHGPRNVHSLTRAALTLSVPCCPTCTGTPPRSRCVPCSRRRCRQLSIGRK